MVKFCNNETGHVIPACEGGRHTGRKSSAEFPLGLALGTRDSAKKWVVLAPDGAVAAKSSALKWVVLAPDICAREVLDVSSGGA